MTTATMTPATQPQLNLIAKLRDEKNLDADGVNWINQHLVNGSFSKDSASKTITRLMALTSKVARQTAPKSDVVTITEAGFYRDVEGAVYKVQESKTNRGRFYAKAVTAHGWDYDVAKGVVYRLTPAMQMTVADVMAFGVESEICAICSQGLEDPVSKHIGIGPTCGPRFMGKDAYNAAKRAAKADPKVAEQLAAIKAAKAAAAVVAAPQVAQDEPVVDRFDDGYWDRQVQLSERAEDERVAAYEMARDRF